GYPLISVYITGKELKDAFEVDASVTPLMSAAQLYGAGMRWTFNPHRMIFNKVTDCAQLLPDGTQKSIENDKLYRVVTGLYSGQMLGSVNGKSFGILSITPKDARGNPITDFEQQVIRNKDGTEVKEWYALASYLKSLGTVPQKYAGGMGRKIVAPSWNPVELLKHPNWISLMVLALVTLSLVLVAFVTYRVATRKRRKTRTVSSKRRG
ncbi:MAG: 5'-nucleotidase C-terminal domain-containing protein, partial [Clostridia bacterium]